MSQQSTHNTIPPNRTFQRTNISSYTESRRQRFLSLRKQNRELYFEKARKIALNAEENNNNNNIDYNFDFTFNNNKINFHNDFETDTVPTNKYKQYPANDNKINNNITMQNDNNNNNSNNTSPKSNKKKKRKKKKNGKHNNKIKINVAEQRELRMKHVEMFMVHEWMIDIPNDLTQNWLVGLRAEGERCLVYATNGRTISRNRTGNFIHSRFPSSLPCGNYIQQKKSSVTILDCIWIQNIKTYYVIDCILWNDQKIGLSDAQFRLWFIQSKLNECYNINNISKYNKYRFVNIQTMNVNIENLNYLYSGGNLLNNQNEKNNNNHENKEEKKMEYQNKNNDRINYELIGVNKDKSNCKWYKIHPDGLIFYHKNGCYVSGLSCPLILIWKDNIISRWFIDTSNRQNKNKLLQFITLQLQNNGNITTFETDIILNNMPIQEIQKYNFKPKQLLRFSITNAIMNECTVDNLLYIKKASVSKMQADTWSKIVFQHQAKHNCSVIFQDIINYISNNNNMNQLDNDVENGDDQLRVATLGLSNLNL